MQIVVKGDRQPIYTRIYKLDVAKEKGHTGEDVKKLLEETLPVIAHDYKTKNLFLVRDGNRINCEAHNFTNHEPFKNVYCFAHLIIVRVNAISNYASNEDKYRFETSDGYPIPAAAMTKTTLKASLLTKNVPTKKTRKLLGDMARATRDDSLWKCLDELPSDTNEMALFLKALRLNAEVYKLLLQGTVGQARPKLKEYNDFFSNFNLVPLQGRHRKQSWEQSCSSHFTDLLELSDSSPLQCFTLCCDEHFADGTSRFVSGAFLAGAASRTITCETANEALNVLCNGPPTLVHCSLGDFAQRVKFFLSEK